MKNKCLNPTCNHDWYQRNDERPKTCPRCKSYSWDDEKHWFAKSSIGEKNGK